MIDSTTSGADLLQLALDWGSTPQERESRPSAVRFGGGALRVDGPADVAARLRDAVPSVDACRAVLESVCPLVLTNVGPYYVFPDVLSKTVEADIRTDGDLPRPETWKPDEWAQLMARELGPWAMAVVDGAVVSIAHTPRPLLDNAAEVGVWTHPGHRGRGLAAAVTAAWAALLRPSGRHLFYSTAKDNHSSQRVAERLGLTLLGWTTALWCAHDVVAALRGDEQLQFVREMASWGAEAVVENGGIAMYRTHPGEVFLRLDPERSVVTTRARIGDATALAQARAAFDSLAP